MEKLEHYSSQYSLCDAISESRALMTDKDKHIYNLLQTSTVNKVRTYICMCYSYTQLFIQYRSSFKCINIYITNILQLTFSILGLKQAEKTAVLQKTGPCPKWYTPWRTRSFVLKGNFLYYYKPNTKVIAMLLLLSNCVYRSCKDVY